VIIIILNFVCNNRDRQYTIYWVSFNGQNFHDFCDFRLNHESFHTLAYLIRIIDNNQELGSCKWIVRIIHLHVTQYVVPLPLLAPIQHYICDNHLHSYLLSTTNACNCWCTMTESITIQAPKVVLLSTYRIFSSRQ